jgi:hypothetical protein
VTRPRFELALPLEPTCSSKFVYRLIDLCVALLEMVIDEHEEVRQWIITSDMCELGREALNAQCFCSAVTVMLSHSREFKNISVAATAILLSVFV